VAGRFAAVGFDDARLVTTPDGRHGVGATGPHHRRHRLPAGGRVGSGHRPSGQGAAGPAHPAGRDARAARGGLVGHLLEVALWQVRVTADVESSG
jgi:hypothetical protein